MVMTRTIASLLAFVAAALALPAQAALPPAAAWEIGPVIKGRNYSQNMPLRPTSARDGIRIEFPYPDREAGHVHYVTFRHGPLEGKRRIVMRYRIEAAPGTRFIPQEFPERQAVLSLYFQQRGDNWTAKGPYETYRWYSPAKTVVPLTPGDHEIAIDLEGDWISVYGKTPSLKPEGFRKALANTARVGFTMGTVADGRGHGVFATGPATLTVTSFEIE